MNFKTTLVLLVLLAGVGAYIFFTNRNDQSATTQPKNDDVEQKVLPVAQADVQELTLESAGGEKFTLHRGPTGAWRLTAPVNAPADGWQADSLVRDVTDVRSQNRVPLDADPQGLAKPAYTVTLKDKAGKISTLAVGARSAVGDVLYVKAGDESQAHVVAGSLVERLDKPAMSYREPKLVDAAQDRIESLSIARAEEPAIKLQKSGAEWQIVDPHPMPAEGSEVTGLLIGVTGLSATEFVAEDAAAKAAQYGLDKPMLTLTVQAKAPPAAATAPATTAVVGSVTGGPTTAAVLTTTTQPAPLVVRIGRYVDVLKKDVYAAVEGGPVVKLPASVLETFEKSPLDLRDRKVVNIDPESVERVTITRDLQATTQPTKREASKSTVVIARRAEEFVPAGPPAPAKKPADAKPADPATTPKSDASGSTEGEAVLAAAKEKAATVPVATTAASATQAATAPASQPATAPVAPPPPPTKWLLESDLKGDAADAKVQSLLAAFHPLRAEKYLAAPPKDAKPIGTYTVKIETASTGGKAAQTIEVRLTDSGSGPLIGQYGDVFFEVDRSLLEKFEGSFEKGAAGAESPAEPATGLPPGFDGPGGFRLPPGE